MTIICSNNVEIYLYFIREGDNSGDLKPIGEKIWLFETS